MDARLREIVFIARWITQLRIHLLAHHLLLAIESNLIFLLPASFSPLFPSPRERENFGYAARFTSHAADYIILWIAVIEARMMGRS